MTRSKIRTSGAEGLTLSSTDITIASGDLLFGTSAKGVNLGVTSNTDGNTLDDYEEGDFTPTMTPSSSGSINLANNVDRLAYTKVGRLVHIHGLLETTSKSSPVGNIINIASLPFTPVDATEYSGRAGGCISCQNVAGTSGFTVQPYYILEGAAVIYLKVDASTVHPGGSPSYTQFYFDITYITS
tara:strand:- start:92 stop:646 length:555 start_codon:yes stop_codon:yes gene_type:complete